MKFRSSYFLKSIFTLAVLIQLSFSSLAAKSKVLIFCKTAGFHHNSIAVGVPAIIKLGQENNFDVDTTTNSAKFTLVNLKQYAAVIFLSTTGDVLNDEQQKAFEQYIRQVAVSLGCIRLQILSTAGPGTATW